MSLYRSFPVLALIAALAAPLAAGAQTQPPAPPPAGDTAQPPAGDAAPGVDRGKHHRSSFLHALRAVNLTPAQQQQVAAFHDQEQKANLNADGATRTANAKKMRSQILGILTSDQKTQLSAQLHRLHHMTPGAGAPNPAPQPGAN